MVKKIFQTRYSAVWTIYMVHPEYVVIGYLNEH